MHRTLAGLLALSSILTLAVPVAAQDARAAREACREDVQRLCAGVPVGGGRLATCLQEHSEELSDGCRPAIEALREKRQAGQS